MAAAKRTVSQQELKRLMQHQKQSSSSSDKVDSPLAKYSSSGQLSCAVCRVVVAGASLWSAHTAGAKHQRAVASLRQQRDSLKRRADVANVSNKRAKSDDQGSERPVKKGILKNSVRVVTGNPAGSSGNSNVTNQTSSSTLTATSASCGGASVEVPADFFDARGGGGGGVSGASSQQARAVSPTVTDTQMTVLSNSDRDKKLPEGFFDDPAADAKARNVQYRDPVEEEWQRFQREMNVEMVESAELLDEDQQLATTDRQLASVDEQIHNLSRVISVERKKSEVCAISAPAGDSSTRCDSDDSDTSIDDTAEFDEFLDWRAKNT